MRNRYATLALSVLMFAALGLSSANAQTTITVGTGTSSSTYPVYSTWWYSGSVALYTSTELGTAGWNCGSGTITNLRWNVATTTTYQSGTIRIWMKNTSATSVASGAIDTSGTLVWAGSHPGFTATGWKDFTLQNNFSYTNGSNLLVTVQRLDNNWGGSPYFYYTSTSGNMHASAAQDNSMPTTLTANTSRPNLQMVFSANCAQPPAFTITSAPSCPSASNQNVVATITVSGGTVSDARLYYRKNGGSWFNTAASGISGSSYTFIVNHTNFGGVVGGDLIEYYLGAISNANMVSTSPAGGSGTTPPGSTPPSTFYSYKIPPAIPYLESFEAGLNGWTLGGTNSSWRVGTPPPAQTPAYQGTNALVCSDPNNSNYYHDSEASWAMSPTFNFTGATQDPVLVFEHKYGFEGSWDGGKVEYTTNGGATWIQLGTVSDPNGFNWYDAASVNGCTGPVFSPTSATYKHSVRTLTGLAGQGCVQIRFFFCSDGSVYTYPGWTIDNVQIGYFPQKDIQIASATLSYAANRWAFVETLPHTVTANIQNNGWEANPTTVTLVYKIGSAPTSAVDGVAQTFTPTWVNGKATCVFTTPIVPAVAGPMNLYVKAFYTGDLVPANDQIFYPATIQGIKVFGYEDFEGLSATGGQNFRTGWTWSNLGGPNTWGVYQTILGGSAAPTITAYLPDGNPNDAIISPPALLAAGSSYRIRFKAAVPNGSATLKLLYGKTPDVTQMTLINTWTVTNTTFQSMLGPIVGVAPYFNTDPSTATNYYIAFQVVTPMTSGSVQLDDIILDENPTPPPKIGYGLPGTANGSHIDNPATPMQFFAIYKKPGVISKDFEVVSTTYNYGAPGDFLWDVVSNTPWIKVTKSAAAPTLFCPSNPFNPARPRQLQTFTITIDPTQFLPGTYTGSLTMYGKLYNSQYPLPNGISATNEPYPVTVILNVTSAGSGIPGSQTSLKACLSSLTASPTPYLFKDANNQTFAAVTVTSGAIPNMCIETFPAQLPAGLGRYRYVNRYSNVTAGGSGWTANIDWYYTDSEMLAGGVTRPDKLRNIRQVTTGGVWQDPTLGVTSASFPAFYYVRGTGYTPANIGGNHCLATSWVPKEVSGVIPNDYALGQNYPNPFNPSTKIDFSVPEEGQVRLVVYNSLGDEVATLVNDVVPAGSYSVPFDASSLPSGVYVYRLVAGSFSESKRMMLAK